MTDNSQWEIEDVEILISTGALIGRPNGRDYRLLLPLSKQLDCDGYEFMMYDTWYEEINEILLFMAETGVRIPVFHCEKTIGESISIGGEDNFYQAFHRFEQNAEMAEKLGAGKMVLHLWDGITSDAFFNHNIDAYEKLREIAAGFHQDLLVENVVCNQKTPMEHWCELRDKYSDVHFVFDTKMAAFHGQMELLYEDEYAWLWREGHIKHFHVNDYAGGIKDWANLKTLPIGKGNVDFKKFFAFLVKINYTGTITLESTAFDSNGAVDTEMLNQQVKYVRENKLEKENFSMFEEIIQKMEQAIDTDEFEFVQTDCMIEMEEKGAGLEVVDSILEMMERHPLSDFGMPGDAAYFMEKFSFQGYEEKLIASIKRVPTVHTIWLLHRCFNDPKDTRHDEYKKLAMDLLASDTTAPEIKDAIKSLEPWE